MKSKLGIAYIYFNEIKRVVNTPNYQRPLSLAENTDLSIIVRGAVPDELAQSAKIHNVPIRFGISILDFLFSLVWSFFKVLSISRRRRIDFIETHSDYSHFLGWILSKLGYGWIADIWDNPELYIETSSLFGRIQLGFLRRFLKTSHLVISLTHPDVLKAYKIPAERLVQEVNGVVLSREEVPIDKENSRIVYVGYVRIARGIGTLLKAFSLVQEANPQSELVLIGPVGNDKNRIQEMIDEYKIESRVKLTGEVPHEKALALIRDCMIGVYPFPRLPFLENVYPVKVPEYMSQGLPVAASNLKGVRTYVKDGVNGMLFEPGNHIQLAEALVAMLDDNRKLVEMSANAYKTAKEFDWRKINMRCLQATKQAYQSLRNP